MIKSIIMITILFASTVCCEENKGNSMQDKQRIKENWQKKTDKEIESFIKQLSISDEKVRSHAIDELGFYQHNASYFQNKSDLTYKALKAVREQLCVETVENLQYNLMGIYMNFTDSVYQEEDRQLLFEITVDANKSPVLRSESFMILTKLKDNRAVDLAISIIKSAQTDFTMFDDDRINQGVLGSVVSYLSKLKYLPAIPEIKKLLNVLIINRSKITDPFNILLFPGYLSSFVQWGYYGDIVAPYLDSLLTSDSKIARYYAAIQLGHLKRKNALPFLIEALNSCQIPKEPVIYGMISLNDKGVIPSLKKELKDVTIIDHAKIKIVDALQNFGYKFDDNTREIIYEPPEYKNLK